MPSGFDTFLSRSAFEKLRRAYREAWGFELFAVDAKGARRYGRCADCEGAGKAVCGERWAHALDEALRWGEATIEICPRGDLLWGVPLMWNQRMRGGVLATAGEAAVYDEEAGRLRVDLCAAATDLRRRMEEANLANAALLAARRREYERERKRAEAIHETKAGYYYSMREVYLREEPALMAAIRRSDRREARAVLNRLLVVIYHLGGGDLNLTKSFVMELVVTMCRAAVETGGDPQELLGTNFQSLGELSGVESEEALSRWLVEMLERIMDAIRRQVHHGGTETQIGHALLFMREHFHENISRDRVAEEAHMSPSHFSRQLRRKMGRTFSDLLNQLRVDRAVDLLVHTDRKLSALAAECGFSDQSYFTKVFRRYAGMTPHEYRMKHQL